MSDRVQITGLREFQKALKQADANLPKMLRVVLNDTSNVLIDYTRPRIPSRTGRARASLKARSSQRAVRIAVGGTKAPWYPWLDFGGEGRHRGRPTPRPFLKAGRYLYPGLAVKREEITAKMSAGLVDLAKSAGLDVT
jgi:hypothetical protein